MLSTAHARSTAGTISRLVDMGVEPYLLADTINLIVAQRLVRTICKTCRESYIPGEEEILSLDVQLDSPAIFYWGKGCRQRNFTGYRGRAGLFEIMNITEEERGLIGNMEGTESLYKRLKEKGIVSLREDGGTEDA